MTTRLIITGMHCAGCALGVKAALGAVPGVTEAKVDLASRQASVEHVPTVELKALVRAVEERGFTASPAKP